MNRTGILALVPLLFLTSCTHRVPMITVELIDTSLSIRRSAEASAFDAVREQIQHMERGDCLILIPITGKAENDAGGRILRLCAPARREPYNADLRRFRADAEKRFDVWATAPGAERYRTDLLGSLDAARQKLLSLPAGSARRLVVASDFIEDDSKFRFAFGPSLANASRARALASRLRTVHGFSLHEVPVCLGRLESVDFATLSPKRQEAIDAFWGTYLAGSDRASEIEIDGVGMLQGTDRACFKDSNTNARKQGTAP